MPYNRYNDTLQTLNAGAGFVNSMSKSNVTQQAMGNSREDRAIERVRENQVNANLTNLDTGRAMVGTNQVQNESKRQFTNAALVDQTQQGIEISEIDRVWVNDLIEKASKLIIKMSQLFLEAHFLRLKVSLSRW